MAAMVYLALDKKSNFPTRLASLGALALMILTLIICIVVVLTHHSAPVVDESVVYVGIPEKVEEVEEENNILAIIVSIVFLLVLFLVVMFLAFRENKRSKEK